MPKMTFDTLFEPEVTEPVVPIAEPDPSWKAPEGGTILVPTRAGKRTLLEIKKDLYPRHEKSERQFTKAGASLTYIPWHHAVKILDKATGGYWSYEITRMEQTEKYAIVAVRVTIHASDGDYAYDGQGLEPWSTTGYGDPLSNAESMAFRRAAAHLGLGLYLYHKD